MSNIKADSAQALLPSLETQEKRCAPRRPISCFIVVNFFRQRIVAKCIDYSRDGFGAIIRGCDLPLEWIVTIELPMHGKKPLKVQARPIYRKGSKYGFEFLFRQGSQREDRKRELVVNFF